MYTFNGKELKDDLSIDSYVDFRSGETVYVVCDSVGEVFSTIFEHQLERFYK